MKLITAIKGFFTLLGNSEKSLQMTAILQGNAITDSTEASKETEQVTQTVSAEKPAVQTPSVPVSPERPVQSEAITLLASLQREARFLDFIKESLQGYSPAEIGAACLSVHDQCADVLERYFKIRPVRTEEEQSKITVDAVNPARCTVSGKSETGSVCQGILVHPGWQATKCELPKWTGNQEDANILAPFEIEV